MLRLLLLVLLTVTTPIFAQAVPEFDGVYLRMTSGELVEILPLEEHRINVILRPGNSNANARSAPDLHFWRQEFDDRMRRMAERSQPQQIGLQAAPSLLVVRAPFPQVESIVMRGNDHTFSGIGAWASLNTVARSLGTIAGYEIPIIIDYRENLPRAGNPDLRYVVDGYLGYTDDYFRMRRLDQYTVEYVPREDGLFVVPPLNLLGGEMQQAVTALEIRTPGGTYLFRR